LTNHWCFTTVLSFCIDQIKLNGKQGEVMVFPRGLLHFQMNVGDGPATILGSFDTGLMRIPNAVFG